MELVERKDNLKEGAHAIPEFEEENRSKITALCLRATRSKRVSSRGGALDSGFGHVATVV